MTLKSHYIIKNHNCFYLQFQNSKFLLSFFFFLSNFMNKEEILCSLCREIARRSWIYALKCRGSA
ncbi:hypothetical protein LINPERPRIM_LOCUS35691 [Linum perenne]